MYLHKRPQSGPVRRTRDNPQTCLSISISISISIFTTTP